MSQAPVIVPQSEPSSRWTAVSRGTVIRAVVAAVLLIAGLLTMQVMQSAFQLTFNKPPMKLTKPLGLLSRDIATRYVADGPDRPMDEAQVEVLGTNDYLLRAYQDMKKRPGEPTSVLHLNLNYYPSGSSAPHVPEICWAGVGKKEAGRSRYVFDVPNVRRLDGSVTTLRVRMISFLPPGEAENPERLQNVAYLFNVNDEYVATPQEVISRFWKASNKYAYDTKIEVTVGGGNSYCSQAQAQEAVADFLRASIEEIEKCLPAAQPGAVPAAGASQQGTSR
jgi:hypothetical protein